LFIIITVNANDYITVTMSWTKRCKETLQCQQVCSRRAEYSARNDERPAEVSHWKLDWKRKVFSSWRNVDGDEAALTEEIKLFCAISQSTNCLQRFSLTYKW